MRSPLLELLGRLLGCNFGDREQDGLVAVVDVVTCHDRDRLSFGDEDLRRSHRTERSATLRRPPKRDVDRTDHVPALRETDKASNPTGGTLDECIGQLRAPLEAEDYDKEHEGSLECHHPLESADVLVANLNHELKFRELPAAVDDAVLDDGELSRSAVNLEHPVRVRGRLIVGEDPVATVKEITTQFPL